MFDPFVQQFFSVYMYMLMLTSAFVTVSRLFGVSVEVVPEIWLLVEARCLPGDHHLDLEPADWIED